ncbi:PKD domain-containing protein [Chitinophaga tropicalis]|uniref:PKD domain-containing protein n=1 Tax=Chitinophaga tropicalis TaxID=2683588 RepID=A0A7K1UB97_9BACT|nr:PKD domain-containing protein [Chitinophaga tropicalis]MVT11661.1 PKD domain-containing protein [Chitinophaga tropicalis]
MTPRKPANERKIVTYRPFSKITSHIDPMVLYTFLSLLAISIVILAFQAAGREDCSDASIILDSQQHAGKKTAYYAGEVLTFRADAKGNNNYSWDFGDSTASAPGQQVYHSFKKAGSYMVTLKRGKCSWHQEVIVLNAPSEKAPDTGADLYPVIEGPEEVFAGRTVVFSNRSPNAKSWQWQLLQPGAEVHSGPTVKYTFSSPGERILSLIVNGDSSKMVKKYITVFAAPQQRPSNDHFEPIPFPETPKPAEAPAGPPPAPEKKAPNISDDEFKYLLSQVVDKQKNAADFSAYLCDNLNARVLLNDKDTDTFSHFCSRIRGKKRFKIEVVNLIKDKDGCVKEIRIRYDRKFLGIF